MSKELLKDLEQLLINNKSYETTSGLMAYTNFGEYSRIKQSLTRPLDSELEKLLNCIHTDMSVKEVRTVALKLRQALHLTPKITAEEICEEDVNLVIGLAYQGYKLEYDYKNGFLITHHSKVIYQPNKFANDYENNLQARISIMKEWLIQESESE